MKKITSNIVEFDLSLKQPAMLALGLRYPKDIAPKEFDGWKINGDIEIKLFKNGKLIKSEKINRINRTWEDFDNTGYKVSVFYTFVWSPGIKIPGISHDNKAVIDLKNKFQNFDLILFDAGIK